MKSPFYRIFVGHYKKTSELKSDLSKIREYGLFPSIFKEGDGYSIMVTATLKRDLAENVLTNLIKKGFDAYLKEPEK